jgi:aryl-alcohol dehydrogenase-like predicted oxidoreductase
MEGLTAAVRSGKARHIGFSEWTPEQIHAALEVPGAVRPISSQPQYNMIWRVPETEVFKLCAEHGISQIVWSPLGQGVLTGKYEPGLPPPEGSRAASDEMGFAIERYMRDEVASAIVGASRPEQVHANAAASGVKLSPDTLAAIDKELDGVIIKGSQLGPFANAGVKHR